MTIDPAHFVSAAGPIGQASLQSEGAGCAHSAATAIGLVVVSRVLGEFGIGTPASATSGDVYGLSELTDAIAAQLPTGDSTSQGALARAVETLAGAVAEDLAARADGLTLDRIDRVLAQLPQPERLDLASVTDFLEAAAARLGPA